MFVNALEKHKNSSPKRNVQKELSAFVTLEACESGCEAYKGSKLSAK